MKVHRILGACLLAVVASRTDAQALPPTALTVVHRFSYAEAETPTGQLVQAPDGAFYGALFSGGANGGGAIFSISDAQPYDLLFSFGQGSEPAFNDHGSLPLAGLVLGADGDLYGTTMTGGPNGGGTVFRLTTGGSLTTLGSFGAPGQGQEPFGGLILANDGYLYGTTAMGDSSQGSVFRVSSEPGSVETVFAFPLDASAGGQPGAALVQDADGTLYGTTRYGARVHFGDGGVFRLPAGGAAAANLVSFPGDLYSTMGSLIFGADHALYGLSNGGDGANAFGFVYRVTTDGMATVLHAFGCLCGQPEGSGPVGALLLASDGNFYGVTTGGGVYNKGVIFQMTPAGSVTTVHSFTDQEGDYAVGGLIEAQDGRLYGMTSGAFTHNATLYKLALIPTAPSALQVTATINAVSLSWTAVKGASTYTIYQGTAAGDESSTPALTQITASSADVSGLTAGTVYYFRVTAVNEAGEGQASAEVSGTPRAPAAGGVATPASGGGGGAVDATWLGWLAAAVVARCARRSSSL